MKELLCGSDSDTENTLTVNKSYADRYNTWREKEELQKLKDRYGDEVSEGSSSSSDEEDEHAEQLTKNIEKDFFKTLSCLKKKDPRIYDPSVKFFKGEESSANHNSSVTRKEKKEKPLFLRDYERKIITERGGKLSDDEEDLRPKSKKFLRTESPTLVEEQRAIKESFKNVLQDSDEDDDKEAWGGLFQQRKKTREELEKEEDDYLEWLKGQRDELSDKEAESDLKYLHGYWNDPKLDSNEIFLRDYLLNKRFLDAEDDMYVPTYNEIVHDSDDNLSADETTLQQQEEFEHKFNFRFEEPDKEFIKRYPRTMDNSLRRKDDRRKRKREEIRQRKEAEKAAKQEEIKKLKALKRKEIMEKIEKLKLVTGNNELGFKDEDIEGDFDPEEYDKRMHQLFNEEYYTNEADDTKPEFPEIDEELEIENWEKWGKNDTQYDDYRQGDYEPHCEDPEFNMDCDYDPASALQAELIESTKNRKKRRQSKFAEMVSKPKPSFNPDDQTFDEYLNEYYKLDCEDIIGDLPCRFKYRKVVPNSFGLTIDEILRADDKELNQWCSLRKAVQYRPEHVERYDVVAYNKKAQNERLKRKILKSLYAEESEEEEQASQLPKKKKFMSVSDSHMHKKRTENVLNSMQNRAHDAIFKNGGTSLTENNATVENKKNGVTAEDLNRKKMKKKKKKDKCVNLLLRSERHKASLRTYLQEKKKNKINNKDNFKNKNNIPVMSDARLKAYGINPKKFKNKMKYGKRKDL